MGKKLTQQAVRGQLGINVVEEAILGMGFKWSPGNGSLDTGLDGDIELVDPVTREAKNILIRAQVKGRTTLDKESSSSFEFACSKADVDYWLAGNAPVILIVVKLGERGAWWISVPSVPMMMRHSASLSSHRASRRVRHGRRSLESNRFRTVGSIEAPHPPALQRQGEAPHSGCG